MKLSVIIPVYNEQQTIEEILTRVQAVPLEKEIIVVDDGSTDATRAILKKLAGKDSSWTNVKVLIQEENKGKGAAIRSGLKETTGEVIAIQDADLEYNPADYLRLVQPIATGKARVVYGSRFLTDNYFSPLNRLANKFLTFLVNLLYGSHLTDMETCYKVFRREIIKDLHLESNRFEIEVELTCKFLLAGIRIYEIPISYTSRRRAHGKKIGWTDGLMAVWYILKYRFCS